MYYVEGETSEMIHHTYINNDKVMESLSSVVNANRKYNTKFQAGVFRLNRGDSISVRGASNKRYRMQPHKTFFGAVMLFAV